MDYIEGILYPVGATVGAGCLLAMTGYIKQKIYLINDTQNRIDELMRRLDALDVGMKSFERRTGDEIERTNAMVSQVKTEIIRDVESKLEGINSRLDDLKTQMTTSFEMIQSQHAQQVMLLTKLIEVKS